MVNLYDSATGALIGTISDEDLTFMQDDLEEESLEDTEYYINQATVDWFETQGADPALVVPAAQGSRLKRRHGYPLGARLTSHG